MPISIQRYVTGNRYVIACVICDRNVRIPTTETLERALARWDGCQGSFNGKRDFICRLCINEAITGVHVGGWRW